MKRISLQLKRQVIEAIKDQYLLRGSMSQKDIASKYRLSDETVRNLVGTAIKEMASEKIESDKKANSEDEIAKYGIPEKYKLSY